MSLFPLFANFLRYFCASVCGFRLLYAPFSNFPSSPPDTAFNLRCVKSTLRSSELFGRVVNYRFALLWCFLSFSSPCGFASCGHCIAAHSPVSGRFLFCFPFVTILLWFIFTTDTLIHLQNSHLNSYRILISFSSSRCVLYLRSPRVTVCSLFPKCSPRLSY